ncbi:TolB family protein, partial [Chloroflexus sp.]|uniref:TolB family protein n=1 Tax=Chloroflexus sp. TaxID=1904827 RepID=UPI003C776FFC
MKHLQRMMLIIILLPLMLPTARPLAAAPFSGRTGFADPRFETIWARTDSEAVRGGRTWYWGPGPWFDYAEFYADSPNGLRTVQYFDKARMEINRPADGIVTNGLLVVEMVSGRIQLGDIPTNARQYRCSDVPVAGNPRSANPASPGYCQFTDRATFPDLYRPAYRDPERLKQRVSTTIDINGNLGEQPDLARPETTIVQYSTITGHNIPQVFWDFMNRRGKVFENSRVTTGPIVDWLFAMGYPITDPYWVRAVVGDTERDVLVQLFERRVLTYTPDNPAGYQVEMGNVGQHYFQWRYSHLGTPWAAPDPVTPLIYASNIDTGSYWELYRANFNGGGQRITFNNNETVAFSWLRSWDPAQQMLAVDSRRDQPGYRQVYALNSIAASISETAPGASATRISTIDVRDQLEQPPDKLPEFLTKPVNEFNPMVSPDGTQLLVVSERTGRPDLNLWSGPAPGSLPIAMRLTRDLPACRYETPAWSPDGRVVYWVSDCDGNFEIYRAELRYQPIVRRQVVAQLFAELTNIRNLTNNAVNDRFARVS